MQRCKYIRVNEYHCIQWTGDNFDAIKNELGGMISRSPFSKDELAIKGGDSYYIMKLHSWILQDDLLNTDVVDNDYFQEHYQLIEA